LIFERVRSEGLAHFSYFISSGGGAVVIDPRRDCQVYLDLARRGETRIRHVFETHRNEDYVIGSLELARLTGARIYHGPGLDFRYGESLGDGQQFQFGGLRLTAIHTPGHTDESTSYMLADLDSGEEAVMVFTGDTLFVGDVGRIDLYGPEEASRLAGNLYHSIFKRLLPLGDGVIICPAHGAGSVCGGAIGDREESTLGLERVQNPILQRIGKEDFVQFKVKEHHERPPYFRMMEKYNVEGPPLLDSLPRPSPLSPKEFEREMMLGAMVLDTRAPPAFGVAHIGGSYNIWLKGLASYAGWVLPYEKPVLLVLEDEAHLEEAVRYLIRLGYDRIAGYLRDGIEAWHRNAFPIERLTLLTVRELKERLDSGEDLAVLDVRGEDEWAEGHIEGASHIYMGHLESRLKEVPTDRPVAVICTVANRASLGASILRRGGIGDVSVVLGSMSAWQRAGCNVVK
jgi:hydroxyacylglutathione hydrolase